MKRRVSLTVSTMLAEVALFACGVQQRTQTPTYGIGTVLSLSLAPQKSELRAAVLEVSINGAPQRSLSGGMEFFNSKGESLGVRTQATLKGEECLASVLGVLDSSFAPLVFCDRTLDLSAVTSVTIRQADGTSHTATNISVSRALPASGVTVFAVNFL